MTNDANTTNKSEIIEWVVPEFQAHFRTKNWYIGAISIALILLIISFFTSNFLFAVIIIITTLIMILKDGQEPEKIKVKISGEGILVGQRFYDYDEFSHFYIIYKPSQQIKNLYFEFHTSWHPKLIIPLENMNPLTIRENLVKYLTENPEKNNLSLSEEFGRFFKI